MENLNMYEEPPAANQVTMDALGNTNQDIYNNPFGDFNNQLISDVAIGKSTEITDLVMQQQPENAFCNLTDTMNNINNNKFNNGHGEDNFMMEQESPQSVESSVHEPNDDNNNSNDNLGPETDVDAIDEDLQHNVAGAVGGEKEKIQMEFKETEDVADRAEIMDFGIDNSAAIYDTLESKIFETMSLQNPGLIKGENPFMSEDIEANNDMLSEPEAFVDNKVIEREDDEAFLDNKMVEREDEEGFMDNKMVEEVLQAEAQHHFDDFAESMEQFHDNKHTEATNTLDAINEGVAAFVDQLTSVNEAIEEIGQQPQAPEADLGFVEVAQQPIGESGGEESEDEWNYVQVDKKATDGLAAVEETSELVVEEAAIEDEISIDQPESEVENNSFNESKKIDDFSEPLIEESLKDFEQEKEPEDERFAQDEIEKDLQLSVDTEDFDDMSQLNPEAAVFVPVSPTRSNGPLSPNDIMNPVNHLLSNFVREDAVVSQSPRKGDVLPMEDMLIPSETDFDIEVESRPHEIMSYAENGNGFGSPEALNLKESLQKDDKLEQEYKDEAQQPFFEEEKLQAGEVYKTLESSFTEYSNGFQNIIEDPMNRSFYEGRDNGDIMAPTAGRANDVLNTVQLVPTFDDEQPEGDAMSHSEGSILEFNKEINSLAAAAPTQLDISDHFEAEHFVEEIKGAADKYSDQGLSPTLPEVNIDTIKTVEETFEEKAKFDEIRNTFSAPQEPQADIPIEGFHAAPEIKEPPPTPAVEVQEQPAFSPEPEQVIEQEVKKDSILGDVAVGAAGLVAAAAVAGAVVAEKAKPTSASKPEPKKADVKTKAPIAAKTNPVPAKRISSTTTAAAKTAAPKPLSASSTAKPLPIKKAAPATTTAAAKPKPASASASTRPLVPPVRKIASATAPKASSDVKPAAPRPASTLVKKPATSLAASKPPTRPASASVPSKPKLANGTSTTTERKPLTSSAPSTRVPAKPTSLAPAKPKAIGTSTLTAKPATKPITSRLSVASAEKAAASPTKSTLLNRSLGSAATKSSPRPATSATAAKPGLKDLKSPSVAKTSSLSGAIGIKKPLSTLKKSPATTTSSTTVIKKSPGIKKTTTTTTTVVQKKVVNGDIVKEETTTTQTTSGDPQLIEDLMKAVELSGHTNGNGLTENGAGDNVQMVLDSAAD